MPDALVPLSPEWWLARLYKQLVGSPRRDRLLQRLLHGQPPAAVACPAGARRVPPHGADDPVELHGPRRATPQPSAWRSRASASARTRTADEDTWRIWQANNLDSDSDMAWLEALIGGVSYFHVAPNPKDAKTPHIWVEHASQAIVEHVPGTNRRERAASLKVWDDDWTQEIHATLQLAGRRIYKFRAPASPQGGCAEHAPVGRARGRRRAAERPAEEPARRRLDGRGPEQPPAAHRRRLRAVRPDRHPGPDQQDASFDRLQTQEFGVDPQKWATAFPDEDDDGNPQRRRVRPEPDGHDRHRRDGVRQLRRRPARPVLAAPSARTSRTSPPARGRRLSTCSARCATSTARPSRRPSRA